jgi:hypothetical protein
VEGLGIGLGGDRPWSEEGFWVGKTVLVGGETFGGALVGVREMCWGFGDVVCLLMVHGVAWEGSFDNYFLPCEPRYAYWSYKKIRPCGLSIKVHESGML